MTALPSCDLIPENISHFHSRILLLSGICENSCSHARRVIIQLRNCYNTLLIGSKTGREEETKDYENHKTTGHRNGCG